MGAACLFCNIAEGKIESKKVFEDDRVVAFRDLHPQAPTHVLVIPRKHLASLAEMGTGDETLVGHCLYVAREVARTEKLEAGGFRVVANSGEGAGQSVPHLHFHVLGGRGFRWPPG